MVAHLNMLADRLDRMSAEIVSVLASCGSKMWDDLNSIRLESLQEL